MTIFSPLAPRALRSAHAAAPAAWQRPLVLRSPATGMAGSTPAPTICTVMGTGAWGYSGDGGPARAAQMNFPSGVAVDTVGNLYIADYYNHCIRKVDRTGVISTVAGTGTGGCHGDGGQATAAQLYQPPGVAVDAAGNLYIADPASNRIRKVDAATGIISTVAGCGGRGYGGDGGQATAAQLYQPLGVAVDAVGNLYIADIGNHRIRKVDRAGLISTVAGTGAWGYGGDGGQATAARLYQPLGVAVDAAGNLYIADIGNSRIRKVDGKGVIGTVAGCGTCGYSGDGGPATAAQLNYPNGMVVDAAGNLYIADTGNHRIRKVDGNGTISTVAGDGTLGANGDGGQATAAQLQVPTGVALDAAGDLYIADNNNHRIRKVPAAVPQAQPRPPAPWPAMPISRSRGPYQPAMQAASAAAMP